MELHRPRLDGKSPELVVTNTRDPVNGYAGAIREFVEYVWGWDATVSETIDDSMWKETFDVYVKDKHNLDLKRFFDEKSPFADQDITARMMETVRKGYWNADAETLKTLLTEYVGSVREHGVGCSEHTCGTPGQAVEAGVPVPAVLFAWRMRRRGVQ